MARGVIGLGAARRASNSRCAGCGQRHVAAYLCDRCALGSSYVRRDDPRSPTASTISKRLTASEVRETEMDHLSAIRGIRDTASLDGNDVDQRGEPTFSPRNEWTAHLLHHNHLPHFTRQELTRWGEILDAVDPLRGSLGRTIARQRTRNARRRWTKFCEFWPILALRIFTASLSPMAPRRPKKRLSEELLERIERMEAEERGTLGTSSPGSRAPRIRDDRTLGELAPRQTSRPLTNPRDRHATRNGGEAC